MDYLFWGINLGRKYHHYHHVQVANSEELQILKIMVKLKLGVQNKHHIPKNIHTKILTK